MLELNKIYNMDCLEGMKLIEDNSIDLIVTDPPYNIGKAKWDKIDNYIEWCGKWIIECQRVLKDNGSFYFWHNDFNQLSQIQEWIRNNTDFIFNSIVIWDKGDFRALSWKNPSEESILRSWFNTTEFCLYYTFQDETGLNKVLTDLNNFTSLREYFKKMQEFIGMSLKKINGEMGNRKAEHSFYWNSSQWDIPTQETYTKLIDIFKINKMVGFKEYEGLRQEYEGLRQGYEEQRYTFNNQKTHHSVWNYEIAKQNGHTTPKPVDLISNIIKHSSNANDIILDLFMGSGTTAVSCMQTNRKFIGFELDKGYFKIANQRIEDELSQIKLF